VKRDYITSDAVLPNTLTFILSNDDDKVIILH
jgi:hypothetical protein